MSNRKNDATHQKKNNLADNEEEDGSFAAAEVPTEWGFNNEDNNRNNVQVVPSKQSCRKKKKNKYSTAGHDQDDVAAAGANMTDHHVEIAVADNNEGIMTVTDDEIGNEQRTNPFAHGSSNSSTQPGAFPVAGVGGDTYNNGPQVNNPMLDESPLVEATLVDSPTRIHDEERERIREQVRREMSQHAPVANVVMEQQQQQEHHQVDNNHSKRRIILVGSGVVLVICVVVVVIVLGVVLTQTNNNNKEPAVPEVTTTATAGPNDPQKNSQPPITARLEIKSNMAETGHVSSSARKRAFAVSLYIPGESLEDAAAGTTQYPLVLFSSGAGAKVRDYDKFLTEMAQDGYIVAAMEHTYLDESVFIDGDGKDINLIASAALLAYPHINGPKEHLVRSRDVGCLLDLLQQPQSPEAAPLLCERSLTSISDSTVDFDDVVALIDDIQHVGYMGHSHGGTAAQSMISVSSHPNQNSIPMLANPTYDDRIAAVINYDGAYWLDWVRMGRITKPFLFLASDVGGFWTDNYNLKYLVNGNDISPDVEGCMPDPENEEACAQDYGPLGVGNPFWNKRKIVESRVACHQDGYAIRLKNAEHNSFNVDDYTETAQYNKSVEITKMFLGKYLKRDSNKTILSEIDEEVGTIYANEQVDQSVCDSISSAPDADQDEDGLSNGDELLLFLTSPELKDTDGDLVCDGKEAARFKRPEVWDDYSNPDTSCFGN